METRSLVRPSVLAARAYVPGTTVDEVRAKYALGRIVKLSQNENPMGASPLARAALEGLDPLNIYVNDDHAELREKIGAANGLRGENVVLGHGSNDLCAMIFDVFLTKGDEVVMADPTFSLFPSDVTLREGIVVAIPTVNGAHDLEAMAAAITPRTKMVVVVDPNNPTGTAVTAAAFAEFVARVPAHVLILLDKAYQEYGGPHAVDGVPYVKNRPNTIVTRTMSKIYGLASLRFGYCLTSPEIRDYLERVRLPFNVSLPAARAAFAALDDDAFIAATLAENAAGREYMAAAYTRLGLPFYPSEGNFYGLHVPVTSAVAYEDLLRRGVIVRALAGPPHPAFPGFLRITIGTRDENAILVAALEELVPQWHERARVVAHA
jgi:histidinol-phosphate aminotransferase